MFLWIFCEPLLLVSQFQRSTENSGTLSTPLRFTHQQAKPQLYPADIDRARPGTAEVGWNGYIVPPGAAAGRRREKRRHADDAKSVDSGNSHDLSIP